MSTESAPASLDKWAAWLLHRRGGDDPEQRSLVLDHLLPVRDRVLAGARLAPRDVVLDVGAGDGLIAFGAVERVGAGGRVIFSDVSRDLLEHGRSAAEQIGCLDRMSFVETSAEDLAGIDDASVDVVTTRSVLIYVGDKARAFEQFARVLRSGGRISLFEPINNYFPTTMDEFWGFDASPVSDLVEKLYAFEGWTEEASEEPDPMTGFTDKDLVAHAEAAGFREISLDLVVEVKPGSWVVGWDALLSFAPNPNAHTVGETMEGALTEDEQERFTHHLRPLAEAGDGVRKTASAYLRASK